MPALKPLTTPVLAPMVPTAVLLLLQAPIPPGLLRVLVNPLQTLAVPVIAAGDPLTTNVAVV